MHKPFPAASVGRVIADGGEVRLRDLSLTAMTTPGHTPGALELALGKLRRRRSAGRWSMPTACRAVSRDDYRFSDHPAYLAAYRASIAKIAASRCEILLTPAPVGQRDEGADDRQAAPVRPERLPQLCRRADQAPRRAAGEGSGEMSWRVTFHCTRAEAEALPEADDLFPHDDSPPVLVVDEPDPAQPDDWRLHAYFDREPTLDELVLLSRLAGGSAPADRPPRRGRLGDDEPAGPRADPRRPLLRPHADPSRRGPEGAIASRSTPASPSAPASTRPPPAASPRSIGSKQRLQAFRKHRRHRHRHRPARLRRDGAVARGEGHRHRHRPDRDRRHRATMPRSTAFRSATARASCCSRSPTAWITR